MQVLMSTLWIAIDTDYNKEDSEYGKVFVAVDNVICAPRFYRSFMIDDGMSLIKCGWLSARDGPKYMVCLSVPIKFIS